MPVAYLPLNMIVVLIVLVIINTLKSINGNIIIVSINIIAKVSTDILQRPF